MRESEIAREQLENLVIKLRNGEISSTDFLKGLIEIIDKIQIKDEDLEGITPLMLNFVNRLIQNLEKSGR